MFQKIEKALKKWIVWCATGVLIVAVMVFGNRGSTSGQPGEGSKSVERTDSYLDEGIDSEKKLAHLSFDDVADIFLDLTEKEDVYDSIFENKTLGWMKDLHDKYGALISCYVYYQSEGFCLKDCTTKFRQEFIDNRDWLRFGFHSLEPGKVYGKSDDSDIIEDYHKTMVCLQNIVGKATSVIRVHYYQASEHEVRELMADELVPVTGLLCADDSRRSYYLDDVDSAYIYSHDEYIDKETGMRFISTDVRMEYIENVDKKIEEFRTDAWNNQLDDLVIFMHEWALNDEVKDKTEKMCVYLKETGYQFTFFE